jgi:tRNA (guanine-N7-)-methyltransferase
MGTILKDCPSVALKIEDLKGRIDFVKIFGRSGPVHIEIGTGRGAFLLNEAMVQPKANFVGIEWASKYYCYCVDRIGRWALTNVRMIRTDVAQFLADFLPDSSVECFHIYFPDPWPKKRHHKRRFFCSANVAQLVRCLIPGGTVRIATDHGEYFEQIETVLSIHGRRLEKVEFFPAAGANQGERVGTNFERKYLKEQRQIYTIAVRRI